MELQRQEHEREDKEEERLRKLERKAAIKRGEEVEEEEEECDGYPRSNEIDHPKILRHNLLVQRVSARIVKQLREDSLEVACYSPRTLGYHGYLKHRESNLELKKFQPDSVLYLDIRPEDRSPEVMAKRPWLDGKLGYCVEVERSKKTDAEIKRFADKIVHLNDYFSVVLVTDGRKAMDIMLNRLYKFVHPDTNEPISRLVRTMVIEEKFDEKDPF